MAKFEYFSCNGQQKPADKTLEQWFDEFGAQGWKMTGIDSWGNFWFVCQTEYDPVPVIGGLVEKEVNLAVAQGGLKPKEQCQHPAHRIMDMGAGVAAKGFPRYSCNDCSATSEDKVTWR